MQRLPDQDVPVLVGIDFESPLLLQFSPLDEFGVSEGVEADLTWSFFGRCQKKPPPVLRDGRARCGNPSLYLTPSGPFILQEFLGKSAPLQDRTLIITS